MVGNGIPSAANLMLTLLRPIWSQSVRNHIPWAFHSIIWHLFPIFKLPGCMQRHSIICVFNTNVVSNHSDSQDVCNHFSWAVHSILMSLRPLSFLSLCVFAFHNLLIQCWSPLWPNARSCIIDPIPCSNHPLTTSFRPFRTLRRCAMSFHELLIRYWPHFDHAEVSGLSTSCHSMILLLCSSRFNHFELLGCM